MQLLMLPVEHSEALSRHHGSKMTARNGEGELLLLRVSDALAEKEPEIPPQVSFVSSALKGPNKQMRAVI